jgi:hypothetical protein
MTETRKIAAILVADPLAAADEDRTHRRDDGTPKSRRRRDYPPARSGEGDRG